MAAQQAIVEAEPSLGLPRINELSDNPEMLKKWLDDLFGEIKTFLHNATAKEGKAFGDAFAASF